MQANWPLVQDLVLIGGGHAHALVMRQWGMNPQAGTRLTVINPGPVAPYTGMLPGHIAGHYSRAEMMIDLVRLARFSGARILMARATGMDLDARRITLDDGTALRYDAASIDIGIGSDLRGLPGFTDHAVAAKPLGGYADRWQDFVQSAPQTPHLVIIGAGVGGCELAMASVHRLRVSGRQPQVTLLERASTPLPGIGAGARAALLAQLKAHDVTLLTGQSATHITETAVTLTDGQVLPSDFTLSVAGARPQSWLAATGLDLTDGFVSIGPTLQSSDPHVFAAGDCAHMAHAPRPKAGVFAVRQAPYLLHNLRSALSGGAMRRFQPQSDYLKLISTGSKRAVADKLGLRLEGEWLWRWKDQIDRKFMAKFETYPAMPQPTLPPDAANGLAQAMGTKPMCGGCGAKVGARALSATLHRLPASRRADVLSGPGDDAAILRSGQGVQVLTTDHLRAFSHDPALMSRITAIHAMGDCLAMGAAPQAALAQITLPRLGPALQADMLDQIMVAAAQVFTAVGAEIVGGHTSVGAELTIGFTVTGVADTGKTIGKGGALPGDVLILTKPIGTGTLLAAEMSPDPIPGLLLGEAIRDCLASMTRPLTSAAAILTPHAHAMTDVTGFGLAGHLLEILAASGASATLSLPDVPLLAGAEAAARAGHASTLAPSNRASAMPQMAFSESPAAALLFDPQTAGGLLAAVPKDKADEILAALHAAGEPAALIGTIAQGTPFLTVTG